MAITVSEFVSKCISDKAFLLEACKNIPDELIHDGEDEQTTQSAQGGESSDALYKLMGKYFSAASEVMGCSLGEEELKDEFERQVEPLPKFTKVRFIVRFLRTLVKAGKGKKRK